MTAATCATVTANAAPSSPNRYYDEEMGKWYSVPSKPTEVIRGQDLGSSFKRGEAIPTSSKAPENWTVRALYDGPGGDLFEFDRDGTVVYNSSDPEKTATKEDYAMRQVFAKGKPIWINATVFNMVTKSAENSPGYSFAFAPIGIVRSVHGKFCPVRDIDPIKHQTPWNGAPVYLLDGTCDNSIEFTLGGHKFFTYQGFKKIEDPYFFWAIQYFSDPVTPMYNASGECLRYCDEDSQKKEAALRKAGNSH